MLNKVAFNPSVACQSQPGSSGPMRAKQTMPAQLQMDRSCGSVERGQTALVSCLHCSSAACYASRSLSLSLSLSHAWGGLLMAPRDSGETWSKIFYPASTAAEASLIIRYSESTERGTWILSPLTQWVKVTSYPDRNTSSNSFTGKLERDKELKSVCLTSLSHV